MSLKLVILVFAEWVASIMGERFLPVKINKNYLDSAPDLSNSSAFRKIELENELLCAAKCHERTWCLASCFEPERNCFLLEAAISPDYETTESNQLSCHTVMNSDYHQHLTGWSPSGMYYRSHPLSNCLDGFWPLSEEDYSLTYVGDTPTQLTIDLGVIRSIGGIRMRKTSQAFSAYASSETSDAIATGDVSNAQLIGTLQLQKADEHLKLFPPVRARYITLKSTGPGNIWIQYVFI